jgi:hypothetical protein
LTLPIDANLPDRIGRRVLRSEDPVKNLTALDQLTSGLE